MTNNLQQTSTPPRASFASALAQNPVNPNSAASSKQSSPVKATTVPPALVVAAAAPVVEQSPVVKLPAPVAGNNGKGPVITIDGSKVVQSPPSVKVNPIKFGSFAAAAASMASQNETVSVVSSSNSGPTLPPRTQSAPPSVVAQPNASVVAPVVVAVAAKEEVVVMDPAVVLPVIQEDASSTIQHVQPQSSFNYEESHQQQHQQQYSNYPQQQYQQRPPRYNTYGGQQLRYHNPQHQQGGYAPQQYQQQQPQYQQNPNYRPHHNPNYRPRPQYQHQGGYYSQQQGGYYNAPQQMHQGFYRPHSQQEQLSAGPNDVPFQRPAPSFNNYVRPAVAPVVPANLPSFTVASAPAPAAESVAVAPVATAPIFVKPAPSKIKIVDPATGKELSFGSRPAAAVEAVKVAEPVKTVEPIKAVEVIKVAEPAVKVTEPVKTVEVVKPVNSMPGTPVKKITIVIKDPNSHKELDLSQVVARPVIKEDLAVEELTAAFSQSTKLDEESSETSTIPSSESPAPITTFEHDKTILANLNVDDDELSLGEDDDFTDYSSDEEDEEEVYIPSTIQFNQSIAYPTGTIPFKAPSDATGPWLYSSEFLLQFRGKCTTTPGDLQERLSAAVEKAKAFANSERMSGDRPGRRDGAPRDDRKKRRNNNGGPLGPQAHLLDMDAVLKNRAENAWAPVRSAEELSNVERILREVRGLLNKLTLEKFHVISDKILSMGIMSPDVLTGVIDSVFDKSVNEPRFAPMYAELCYKIVVEELNGLKKTLPVNAAPDSQFRRLLVERCQAEYKHKRAWSKKRLEKLLESPSDKQENGEEAASPVAETAETAPRANVGELTEEDYLLIKLKRCVLGNMRFIGEIFKVGLIGEKIMHSIITELLSNIENPEEEEIECLCRLLMTVGSILDKPEAANFWNQYIGRMNWLISQSDKLSSRVRFLVMDTLEFRDKKWKTGKSEEGPKTIAQIEKEQHNKERNERDKDRDHRGGDHRDKGRHGNAPPPMKFSSNKQQQPSQHQQQPPHSQHQQQPQHPQHQRAEEWNRSGPSNKYSTGGQLNRGPSVRRPQTPQATPELAPASPSVGRFGVLEAEVSESPVKGAEAVSSDEERIKKIISLLNELVQMNNYEDVYEELKACSTSSAKSSALSGLLNRAIESGKKPSFTAVIKIFTECPVIDRPVQLEACRKSFGMIDDLAVDVPSIYETAGQLNSALNFSLTEIFETLSCCSDDMAKTRVILQTAEAISDPAAKEQILKDAKEFVEKNKKPVIENLIKKLNIEI